jgi:hypothetical protein
LMRSMVSVGSMSISISFPVSVLTLIIVPPSSKRVSGRRRLGGGARAAHAQRHAESLARLHASLLERRGIGKG